MIKKLLVTAVLATVMAPTMAAWDLWDEFRVNAVENGRVIDRSESRKVT